MEVTLDSSRSSDPDAPNDSIVRFAWDLDGDGSFEVSDGGPMQNRTFDREGSFSVGVRVFDSSGAGDTAAVTINVSPGSGNGGGSSSLRGDWWTLGRTPKRQYRSPSTGPQDNTEKWRFPVNTDSGVSGSTVFAADGTLYITSGNFLIALNPDGTEKWRFEAVGSIRSTPALGSDGTVYFGNTLSDSGEFFYAVAPDGTEKWRFPAGSGVTGSPAIAGDGTIYFGGDKFYALNPDGTEKWNFESDRRFGTTPAIADDGTVYSAIYTDASGGVLYALAPDGSLKWQDSVGGAPFSSPVVADDGTVYVGEEFGTLSAYNPDGSLKWENQIGSTIGQVSLGSEGRIHTTDGAGNLLVIDPIDGSIISSSSFTRTTVSLIDGEGTVYVGGRSSDFDTIWFSALNPDGSEKWRFDLPGDLLFSGISSNPALDENGTLYFGTETGILYALGTGGGSNRPPSASLIASPERGVAPLSVTLDASRSSDSEGEIVQYEWDWEGDGTFDETGTSPTRTHTYQRGIFLPTVRVTDEQGVVDVARIEIWASVGANNAQPTAALSVSPDSGGPGLTATLDASASSDADGDSLNFDWDWEGDGSFDLIGGSETETHTYDSPGNFQPTVRVTDDRFEVATARSSVSVSGAGNQNPVASMTVSPTSGTSPVTVSYDASGSSDPDGFVTSIDWDLDGDGNFDLIGGPTQAATDWNFVDPSPTTPARSFSFSPRIRVTDDDGAVAYFQGETVTIIAEPASAQ